MYVYIYIYIERERELYIYIYIYMSQPPQDDQARPHPATHAVGGRRDKANLVREGQNPRKHLHGRQADSSDFRLKCVLFDTHAIHMFNLIVQNRFLQNAFENTVVFMPQRFSGD